ncbi:hypothetical protein FP2506_02380 [Fulvimarina pelagi HTCC2506]|uniref:Uncharacterized protein n=1 Tax=Fulvimarina pelagi HTCC2506 TaxID=314231 RepID=Q0FYE4_9HYPH|nr:hypothetical protein FP2506_02380 [Fulvimarina pelagi HTCC2506]
MVIAYSYQREIEAETDAFVPDMFNYECGRRSTWDQAVRLDRMSCFAQTS